MRIAIATTGRFHVLDLARELAALGHEVAFYTTVPRSRAIRFGLPPESRRGLFAWLAPLLALQRYGGRWISQGINPLIMKAADRLIARRLEPCDVFIGMSGLCIQSAQAARERYGARVFIERGSRHILSQKEILDDIKRLSPAVETVPEYAVTRELASYEVADMVVVPSRHTEESFTERGFPVGRLFRNPYGVALSMFSPTDTPTRAKPTVIFVGAWSYQKGCDLLTEAVASFAGRIHLLHVGAVGDTPLPNDDWFEHREPVPQWQLPDCYGQADVFVLASRQDGFGMVLAQAIACGLPIVCTDRTGGEDLSKLTGLIEGIFVVPHDDVEALALAIKKALEWAKTRFPSGTQRDLLGAKRELLSWQAYAMRYIQRLEQD